MIGNAAFAAGGLLLIIFSFSWRVLHRRLMLQRFANSLDGGGVTTRHEALCNLGQLSLQGYERLLADRLEREVDDQLRCCLASLVLSRRWEESSTSFTTLRRLAVEAARSAQEAWIACPTGTHFPPSSAVMTAGICSPPVRTERRLLQTRRGPRRTRSVRIGRLVTAAATSLKPAATGLQFDHDPPRQDG